MLGSLRRIRSYLRLPQKVQAEIRRDRAGLPAVDPGIECTVREALAWLARAQDMSASRDGGVARDYSLLKGWSASYPETTGYIVPTLLDWAGRTGDADLRQRARRMLDWLVSIQFKDGGFPGGVVGQEPCVPVTFNTGQILIGLAAGVREFGEIYLEPMRRAADWLAATQDPDGCWRKHPTPFAEEGEKTYETHVAWGLLEAGRVCSEPRYVECALRNIGWALTQQTDNGWFERCCLNEPSAPLTHTIGYALRGILEGYRTSREPSLLEAARRTGDGLLSALDGDGFLPGRLDSNWRGRVRWACLTGSVQIAHCWLLLYQFTGEPGYCRAACLANRFVRRTIRIDGPFETRGGVKGSWPVDGGYGTYQYLNWACKFFIDSSMIEQQLVGTS